jgi:deoxycytidine triphosphate deaminase
VTQTYDCSTLTDKVAALQNRGFAPDWRIAELVHEFGMIDPFVSVQVKAEGIISYGLSSFGYDMRVTIEISNTTPLPAKIYANEGIAQVLFAEGVAPNVSYADRKGKYQAQTGITFAKVLP